MKAGILRMPAIPLNCHRWTNKQLSKRKKNFYIYRNKTEITVNPDEGSASPSTVSSNHNLSFWFHVLITILAWIGPFAFSWYLMVLAYGIVLLQFLIFGRCLLNSQHDLEDQDDVTFYSYLFELFNIPHNRSRIKWWVRRYVYVILGLIAILWQVVLGFDPLFF